MGQARPKTRRCGHVTVGCLSADDRREYVVLPFTLRVAALAAAQKAIVPLLQKAKQRAQGRSRR